MQNKTLKWNFAYGNITMYLTWLTKLKSDNCPPQSSQTQIRGIHKPRGQFERGERFSQMTRYSKY